MLSATVLRIFVDSNEDDLIPPDDSIEMRLLSVKTRRMGSSRGQEVIGRDCNGLESDSIQLVWLARRADFDGSAFEELREDDGPVVLHGYRLLEETSKAASSGDAEEDER